jgi:hypothetical protein
MLYVGYVHLRKAKQAILSSQRILCKDYDHKGSVEKESVVVSLKGFGTKTN